MVALVDDLAVLLEAKLVATDDRLRILRADSCSSEPVAVNRAAVNGSATASFSYYFPLSKGSGPRGTRTTTRGLKGAGTQCVDVRARLKGLDIRHGGVGKYGAVAVSAAVRPLHGGKRPIARLTQA